MLVMGTRQAALGRLCDQFHIDILYAFGSRAKEVKAWLDETLAHLSDSPADVDIGVKPARGIALDVHQKVHLALALEELFEVSMTPGSISKRIVLDRLTWVNRMVAEIRSLPLTDRQVFFSDGRNAWTAESCLRRALEALFDLGRHILVKGFGLGSSEYKEIAICGKIIPV